MSEPTIPNERAVSSITGAILKPFILSLLVIFTIAVMPEKGFSQGKYYNSGCAKTLYPTMELSVETGTLTGFNISIGAMTHEFPLSAHLLLNFIPSEAGKTKDGAPDIQINPMLMLKLSLINSENYRNHVELMGAGGSSGYRAGIRYLYSFAGKANVFVQPTVSNNGYVTCFGVGVVF